MGPLQALNATARADYAQARERLLHESGPILLVSDKLYLIRGEQREEAPLDPPGYHELKSVAHGPLGVHALFLEGQPDAKRLADLRAAIKRVIEALPALPFNEAQRERQRRILELSLKVDAPGQLAAYEREVAPLLLENAREAARGQVDLIHAAVGRWREQLGPEFARVHVLIISGHMPRKGQVALQYFERLFGEQEGGRIVYAEEKWAEKDALALLGTHLIDATVGQAFFGEPLRMHRDLLADAAAERVKEVLP
jgi:hypothetical protein